MASQTYSIASPTSSQPRYLQRVVSHPLAMSVTLLMLPLLVLLPRSAAWQVSQMELAANGLFRPLYWLMTVNGPTTTFGLVIAFGTVLALMAWMSRMGIGVPIAASLLALTLWLPLHLNVWQQLEWSEWPALPATILALMATHRASRSPHAKWYDLIAVIAILVALLCRNAFVGLVPVLLLVRLGVQDSRHGIYFCGGMLIFGGLALSSTMGVHARPEWLIVGLGAYLIIAQGMRHLSQHPMVQNHRPSWVTVGALLVAVIAWNVTQAAMARGTAF